MENAPGAPPQDPELASMLAVFQELTRLPDDEARRRVIAYAQARCIGPVPPSDFAQWQRWQEQHGGGFQNQLNHGASARLK